MSGGGSGEEIPFGFENALTRLGDTSGNLVRQINSHGSFTGMPSGSLRQRGSVLGGAGGASTFGRFGVSDFTSDNKRAFNLTRRLSGSDDAINQAIQAYGNNAGIEGLGNVNVQGNQASSERALQNFQPTALRNLSFDDLQSLESNPAYAQLLATSQGQNLDAANNPYFAENLANEQQRQIEQYQQQVVPTLASQFGGGFGLGGSASINAQRMTAEDLNRSLAESGTAAYADLFNQERGRQEAATQYLGGLDLDRASNLAGFDLSRAGEIDNMRLSRAGQLGELGLGFSGQQLEQQNALGGLINNQAAGLSAAGQARRAQELQRIEAMNNIGNQQMARNEALFGAAEQQFNGSLDERIARLMNVSSILGQSPGSGMGGGGGSSAAAGALGGAATGAAMGSYFGPYGTAIGGVAGGALGYFGA
jgi:hypothetical protein